MSRTPQPVEFLGGDRRGGAFVLDDLGKGLARHVAARKQAIAGGRPGRDAAGQYVDIAVAEPGEAAGRLVRDPVAIIDQNDPAGQARHQSTDIQFEPAVGQIYAEQRVALAMLSFLADIKQGDLAAIGEPLPECRDINRVRRCGHGVLPIRVSSTKLSVAASIARPLRPRGG